MADHTQTIDDYLKKPYTRVIVPDSESGMFTAKISEFPGCVTFDESPEKAYARLEETARNWIEAALSLGQDIPPPAEEPKFSGKIALRVPKSLHKRSVELAEIEGVSLNQFLVTAISEKVGAYNPTFRLEPSISSGALVIGETSTTLRYFPQWPIAGANFMSDRGSALFPVGSGSVVIGIPALPSEEDTYSTTDQIHGGILSHGNTR